MTEAADDTPWRDILAVCLASLLVFSAFGMLLPVFPLWARTFSDSLTDVGAATTLAAGVGLILARPIAAALMEGRDRRPTLMLGAALSAVTAITFPSMTSLYPVMAVRVVQGMGFGLVTTAAVSLITDLAPPGKRGQVLGLFGAINALSLLLGPVAGGALHTAWGFGASFYGACVVSLLAAPAILRIHEPAKPALPPGRKRLLEVLRLPPLRVLVVGHLLGILLHGALLAFLPLRFEQHTGSLTVEAFFAIDAVALIAFRFLVGARFDRWSRHLFIRGGLACMALSGLLIGVAEGDVVWALAAVLYGLGFGAYVPAVNALVGDVVPETHRARGFAVFMLALDLAIALGGVVFGPIADHLDLRTAFIAAAACPLLALGAHLAGRRVFPPPAHPAG